MTDTDGTIFVRSGALVSPEMANAAERSGILDRLYRAAGENYLQGRSSQALEQKWIKGALGRPTTRVILDVGELISHKAIESARSAGILDVLLDSVYSHLAPV